MKEVCTNVLYLFHVPLSLEILGNKTGCLDGCHKAVLISRSPLFEGSNAVQRLKA